MLGRDRLWWKSDRIYCMQERSEDQRKKYRIKKVKQKCSKEEVGVYDHRKQARNCNKNREGKGGEEIAEKKKTNKTNISIN